MSFRHKQQSKLWWYGIFLVDLGMFLWVISIVDQFLIPVLNILSINDLNTLGAVGVLAFKFALGFGSAATIGWGFTVMAASLHYTKQTRQYLLIGMVVWFILDGISSILSQFYLNLLGNTLLLVSAIYVLHRTDLVEK